MTTPRLHDLLERIAHVLREDLRACATKEGLKLAQLEALLFLVRANRYSDTTSAVVDYLGATKGSVSQTLTALERKGLIERVADPKDGRVSHLRPTKLGRGVARKAYPAPVLDGGDSPALEAHLTQLLTDVQRARGGYSFGQCRTCAHFQTRSRGHACGLTEESLTVADSGLLCREHLVRVPA